MYCGDYSTALIERAIITGFYYRITASGIATPGLISPGN